MPDWAKVVWAYEAGDKTGHPHYQVFVHTFKRHREDEYYYDAEYANVDGNVYVYKECLFDWIKPAYAIAKAENYACKADHTLIPGGGPWVKTHPDFVSNGTRSELDNVFNEVKAGGDYQSFMREGKHLNVCARYPAFIMKLSSIQRPLQQKMVAPTWPVTLFGHTIQDPTTLDENGDLNKRRHVWFWSSSTTTGKSRTVDLAFKGILKLAIAINGGKNFWDQFYGQQLVIIDEARISLANLQALTDTKVDDSYPDARYANVLVKGGEVRQVICMSNLRISGVEWNDKAAVKILEARFTEVEVKGEDKPVQAGYVYEPKGFITTGKTIV